MFSTCFLRLKQEKELLDFPLVFLRHWFGSHNVCNSYHLRRTYIHIQIHDRFSYVSCSSFCRLERQKSDFQRTIGFRFSPTYKFSHELMEILHVSSEILEGEGFYQFTIVNVVNNLLSLLSVSNKNNNNLTTYTCVASSPPPNIR